MTLSMGRRVIVAEGAERWREKDVEEHLAPALASMPPDTTLAMFAREEARAKAPQALHEAVKRAGGQVVAQMNVKPWELAKVGARAGSAARPRPRCGGGESPRRAGRRAPAAAAARAREAGAGRRRARRRGAAHGDASRTSRRARRSRPSGAPTRSAMRSWPATARSRWPPTCACASRASGSPGSPTCWPRGCAKPWPSPSSSRRGARRRMSRKGCGCRRRRRSA